jgi:hypothetical protein
VTLVAVAFVTVPPPPPNVTLAPLPKPFPRIVTVLPPAVLPEEGESPVTSGTASYAPMSHVPSVSRVAPR